MKREARPISRREFFRSLSRYALLSGLAAGAAVVVGRRAGAGGQTCDRGGICRGCPAFTDCGLPQALSARQHGMEANR